MGGTPLNSTQNGVFQRQQRVLNDARFRRRESLIWVEGPRFLEGIPADDIKALFLGPNAQEQYWPVAPYLLSQELAQAAFQTQSPQEVGALIHWRPSQLAQVEWSKGVVIFDHTQDPGNAGNLIRTAAGLDLGAVILINSVDPRNPKVIRSSAGTFFKIPLIEISSYDELNSSLIKNNVTIYIAQAHHNPIQPKCQSPWALVLGSEAHGHHHHWDGQPLSIPLSSNIDSLNVAAAGAILMAQLKNINSLFPP